MRKPVERVLKQLRLSVTFSGAAGAWLEHEAEANALAVTEVVRRIVDDARGARIGRLRETMETGKETVR
jgi:hypothetical protein